MFSRVGQTKQHPSRRLTFNCTPPLPLHSNYITFKKWDGYYTFKCRFSYECFYLLNCSTEWCFVILLLEQSFILEAYTYTLIHNIKRVNTYWNIFVYCLLFSVTVRLETYYLLEIYYVWNFLPHEEKGLFKNFQ